MPTTATVAPASTSTAVNGSAAKTSGSSINGSSNERRKPFFSLGYRESLSQWWSSLSPATAERNVLDKIPYITEAAAPPATDNEQTEALITVTSGNTATPPVGKEPDPYGNRVWRTSHVSLPGKDGQYLNELSIERVKRTGPGGAVVAEPADQTLVILHGYGAGLGLFYQNFEPLTRKPGWRLLALDLLGMGNSARPPFRIRARDRPASVHEAEDWFIDSLEQWRRVRRLDRFTLLGHSLGGYLAVCYALKYPGHLNKLILVSPAGVPSNSYAIADDAAADDSSSKQPPTPSASVLAAEFTIDQNSVVADSNSNTTSSSSVAAKSELPAKAEKSPPIQIDRKIPWWGVRLWDANLSPFMMVRSAGPLGPMFTSGWTSRRFSHLPTADARALHEYAYSLFRQRGSGEYALPYLLAPGAYARRPLVDRIAAVGRGPGETGLPVVMMYGENDWMDVAGGYASEEHLARAREQALAAATSDDKRRRENGGGRVVVVSHAGHHLYLDNPDEFNEAMRREMDETRQHEFDMREA